MSRRPARCTEADLNRAIPKDAPLRLDIAARMAFPGGMSAAILRKEAARGNLSISKIGNAHYTTLAEIERMVEKCRVTPKARTSTSDAGRGESLSGSSEMGQTKSAQAALQATLEGLKKPSRRTSQKSTSQGSTTVIRPAFPSQTS